LNKVCEQRGYVIPFKRPRLHSNAKVSVDVNIKMSMSGFTDRWNNTSVWSKVPGSSKTVSAITASPNLFAR